MKYKTLDVIKVRFHLLFFILFTVVVIPVWGQVAITSRTPANTILQDGVVYNVSGNVTIPQGTAGQSGLQVAQGAKVVINIKAGATLTVTGANADASKNFAGMPGILVPETSTLVIVGEGTLIANGGNGSNGLSGENGEDAGGRPAGVTLDNTNRRFIYSYSDAFPNYGGYGGAGGDGGYGAGAGIGGAGGQGGKGGARRERGGISISYSGLEGNAGGAATKSGGMGKVYVLGNVDASKTTLSVTSTAGNAGSVGSAGINGYYGYTTSKENNKYYSIGGGGGGAAGAAGTKPSYSIGAGGTAGGGGGSGGQGGADNSGTYQLTYGGLWGLGAMNQQNASCEGGPGVGGKTADNKQDSGNGKTTLGIWGSYTQKGGAGGAAGTAGTPGEQGDLYILGSTQSNAYKRINNSTSKPANNTTTFNATTLASNTYKEIVALYQIKLTFDNQGGSTARAAVTMFKGDAVSSLASFSVPTKTGYYFDGYYTEREGGKRIFDHNGNVVDASHIFTENRTLYAHWVSNQFTVTWDYSYMNQSGNLQELNTSDKSKYAKVQFNVGSAFVVSASSEKSGSGAYAGHKIATATITAQVGSGTNNATTIYVTENQLRTLQISATALSSSSISATDNKYISANSSAHEVVLSAIPAGTFMQPWKISITNEKKPDVLHVKLLRADSENGTYEVINQHTTAFACTNNDGYEGTYPVWPQSTLNADLYYKVQIVGYEMDGVMHNVASMPLCTDVSSNASQKTLTQSIALPIVHFNLNSPNGKTAQYASGTTEYYFATTYGETLNLTSKKAVCQDNRFEGWTDEANTNVASVTINREIILKANWADAVPPVITFTGSHVNMGDMDDDGYYHESLDVYVNIEDANDKADIDQWYYVASTNGAIDESKWKPFDKTSDGNHTIVIKDENFGLGYVYIKATDKDGNTSYSISNQYKIDTQAPVIRHNPTGRREDSYSVVCTDDYFQNIEVTVTDNVSVTSIMVNGGKVDLTKTQAEDELGIIGVSTKNGNIYLEKPGDNDRERDDDGNKIGPIPEFKNYTITARDAAGNTSTRLMTVYTEHKWETNSDGSYKIQDGKEPTATEPGMLSHVNCEHCSRYILVNKASQWIKIDTSNQEDLEKIKINIGSVLVKDGDRIYYADPTINGAIDEAKKTYINPDNGIATVIKLTPNTVGAKVAADENVTTLSVPSADYPLILDLNGQSIDKDGIAYDNVTGNANVTILLNDANNRADELGTDKLPYKNISPVTGSPIKYVREFSENQRGTNSDNGKKVWQAFYVPFSFEYNDELKEKFDLAEYSTGNNFNNEADNGDIVLAIKTIDEVTTIEANQPLFIHTENSRLEIVVEGELAAAKSSLDTETTKSGNNFNFIGTLYDSPVSGDAGKANFWVMLNNGTMWWAADGQTQRPYRWVIQPTGGSTPANIRFVMVDEDETDIKDVEAAADKNAANEVYTLDGRKLRSAENLIRGIYIIDGKKVFIK